MTKGIHKMTLSNGVNLLVMEGDGAIHLAMEINGSQGFRNFSTVCSITINGASFVLDRENTIRLLFPRLEGEYCDACLILFSKLDELTLYKHMPKQRCELCNKIMCKFCTFSDSAKVCKTCAKHKQLKGELNENR